MAGGAQFNPFTPEGRNALAESALEEFNQDHKLFDFEIQYQMKMKMNDKFNMEKRERSDFVKPATSENLLYRD